MPAHTSVSESFAMSLAFQVTTTCSMTFVLVTAKTRMCSDYAIQSQMCPVVSCTIIQNYLSIWPLAQFLIIKPFPEAQECLGWVLGLVWGRPVGQVTLKAADKTQLCCFWSCFTEFSSKRAPQSCRAEMVQDSTRPPEARKGIRLVCQNTSVTTTAFSADLSHGSHAPAGWSVWQDTLQAGVEWQDKASNIVLALCWAPGQNSLWPSAWTTTK